jgi:hypothetical protein
MPIKRIRTILNAGERAIALFTRGDRFLLHRNSTGSTGAWLLSTKKVNGGFFVPITVVVYLPKNNMNEIWRGRFISGSLAGDKNKKDRYDSAP